MVAESETVATGSLSMADRKVTVSFSLMNPWTWDEFDFPNSVILDFDQTYDEHHHQQYGIQDIELLFPYDKETT